jgi:hypothetical protein
MIPEQIPKHKSEKKGSEEPRLPWNARYRRMPVVAFRAPGCHTTRCSFDDSDTR